MNISIECVDQCLMTLFNLETVRDHIYSAMQAKFAKYEGSADYHYFVAYFLSYCWYSMC